MTEYMKQFGVEPFKIDVLNGSTPNRFSTSQGSGKTTFSAFKFIF